MRLRKRTWRGCDVWHEGELSMRTNNTPALACTLELNEMGRRLERLRRLADTSLQSHQLEGHVLRLAYRATPLPK
jgi:hypothetical protein